jgi:hypothetical protein
MYGVLLHASFGYVPAASATRSKIMFAFQRLALAPFTGWCQVSPGLGTTFFRTTVFKILGAVWICSIFAVLK